MDTLEKLRREILRHARGRRGVKTEVADRLFVTVEDEQHDPAAGMAEPSVAVVAAGVKRTILHDRPVDYRAGEFLLTSLDVPVRGQALHATGERPLAVVSTVVAPAEIAALLDDRPRGRTPSPWPGLAVSTAPEEMLDAFVRLLRIADRPDDLRVLGAGLRREIHWRLLTGPQAALAEQIGLVDGDLARIARTVRLLREHSAEPVAVADLAASAGLSPSAFHRHFRAATGTSPIQFQKRIRLHRARELVVDPRRTVTEIAHLVGYDSPSQFSRDYRRAFGTTPGRDPGRRGQEFALVSSR